MELGVQQARTAGSARGNQGNLELRLCWCLCPARGEGHGEELQLKLEQEEGQLRSVQVRSWKDAMFSLPRAAAETATVHTA